jgi:hypothetical protein
MLPGLLLTSNRGQSAKEDSPRVRLQDGQVNEGCGVRGRLEE